LSNVHELPKNRPCDVHSLLKGVNEFWLHFSCILDDLAKVGTGYSMFLRNSTELFWTSWKFVHYKL